MNGKHLMIALLVFTAIFGAALWWFQTRAFYERVAGVETIRVLGVDYAVSDYEGVDADTSPLKLRGCFRLTEADAATLAALPGAAKPTPLTAPDWFGCFRAETLAHDLEAGRAHAVAAAINEPDGFDRIVQIYPDGRAYLWRQLNENFAE